MVLNVCQHRLCKFKTHGEVTLSNIKTFLSNACGNKKCHQSHEREKDLSKEKINFLMFIQKNYMKQRQLFMHANIFISDDFISWLLLCPILLAHRIKLREGNCRNLKRNPSSEILTVKMYHVINTIKFHLNSNRHCNLKLDYSACLHQF